ncbi:Tc5 transposase DNA-binding domain [Phytophthora infestans]|uniref:Tc5 transposase DNA-binding domain n=1 Tax=Phytophthora infestans TaxID=4787 RepID=A0A833T3N2_PHYIN|nr:Tc5 transposase DNA-binding domain [Phytophthora infestans]
MTAPPTRKRSFQKRLRLTKQQELQICDLRRSFPRQTFTALASRARVALRLVKSPSLQMVSRVLKAEDELRQLAPDCLARKKQRPLYQLQLDQSMVEFVVWCETSQVSLSGSMIMLQAKRMAARHRIPDAMLPRIGESWLRRFQERYGIRFRHSHGESGAVDLGACAAEIQKAA